MKQLKVDLCIIGAGSGGLSVAAGAAQMGAKVALVEKHKMGGDCLNYGCVPSKALLAAAKTVHAIRQGERFGITCGKLNIDFTKVHAHVHNTIANIAPHDSVERFNKLGVNVLIDAGEFINPKQLRTSDTIITARRFIIATGSTPTTPDIEGLTNTFYLTNETIFDLETCPKHLIIIGGGPIGCEMAQAHRLLGSEVTMLVRHEILPRDDRDLVDVVRQQLSNDGIRLYEYAQTDSIEHHANGVKVNYQQNQLELCVVGSHLLVATGRTPSVNGLGLANAKVDYTVRGITIDERLRTSNKKIFAIGDVIGHFQFTHMANYQAGIVIRNALFRLPTKINLMAIPWVTYTEPELANVGITTHQLQDDDNQIRDDIKTYEADYADNDRAQTELITNGKIKVTTTLKGQVLGATIVGHNAGELLLPWSLAIKNKLKISALADITVAYPTLSEINKRVAGNYYTPLLFSSKTRKLVRFLSKFG